MLRQREKTVSFQAGALSVAVHGGLLLALLISFNWKTTHPVTIAEVELWDSIPAPAAPKIVPPAPVAEQEVKEVVKPEPVVEEQPKNDVQVDIVLEKKLKAVEKEKALEKLKQEKELLQKKKLAEIQVALLKDDLQANEKALKDKKTREQNEALKKLQQETLADDKAVGEQQASTAKAAANAGIVGEFQNKIRAKIRGNVNKTLCGTGNPELKFDIGLLPTGQLSSVPKLIKSSGSVACDEAVERAIMASEPLPLPKDTSLFSQFRDLKLTFRPNDT
jgi:colicin import membrane protein